MISQDAFSLFVGPVGEQQNPRWMVSLTMVFGSALAGSTSEGGAAVAFPVLTLAMGVLPSVARNFSFLIQSVGMTAAAFSICWMRVRVEPKSIFYCTIGGAAGVIFGLEKVAPTLEPAYSKMYFVCIWFSFAFSLFWQNYFQDREVFNGITAADWRSGELLRVPLFAPPSAAPLPQHEEGVQQPHSADIEMTSAEAGAGAAAGKYQSANGGDDADAHSDDAAAAGDSQLRLDLVVNWQALLLLGFGFLGGIFTSISGSGLDICSFALLTLFFRVSERIATPTSVVLMGINTVVAYLYSEVKMHAVPPEAYRLWLVCVPIVVVGAPLGAIMSSHFHRHVLAAMIYLTDTVQLIGALVVVRPWTATNTATPVHLTASSAAIVVAGAVGFTAMAFAGQRLTVSRRMKSADGSGAGGADAGADGGDEGAVAAAGPAHGAVVAVEGGGEA